MKRISRLALAGLAVLCAGLAFLDARDFYAFGSFRTLADAVARGRVVLDDAARIEQPLARLGPVPCRGGTARDVAIIQLYAADLAAVAQGIDPVAPSDAPGVSAARAAAQDRLAAALACAPLDGDLWLRSALMARARGAGDADVAARRRLSEQTTPFEGWIVDRRAAFFPGNG